MDKLPIIRLSTRIFPVEDPELVRLLLPLPRAERSRRVRALLRAGMGLKPIQETAALSAAQPHSPSEAGSPQPPAASGQSIDNLHHVALDFCEFEFGKEEVTT
jgi:hypothetical protein